MAGDKVDDIFRDYKYGDSDEPSQNEIKNRMQKLFNKDKSKNNEEKDYKEEIMELKEQVRELREHVKGSKREEKEPKVKHVAKHVKPEPKFKYFSKPPSSSERIVLIGIIIVLSFFIIIDLSFFHRCEVAEEEEKVVTEVAVASIANETEEAEEEVVKEESVEEEEEEEILEEEEEETELSGKVDFKITKIYSEVLDEDMGEISKIIFTVENGKDMVLKPIVDAYIYDDDLDESYETRSRGQYVYNVGINPGDTHTGTVDICPKRFINLDLEKHIRLSLNDTEEGFIKIVKKDYTIS